MSWVSLGRLCAVLDLGPEAIRRRRVAGLLVKDHHYLELPGVKTVSRRWHLERCLATICGLNPEEARAVIAEHRASQEVA
jgi:hypothetical protein